MASQCLCEFVSTLWVKAIGLYRGYGQVGAGKGRENSAEEVLCELDERLVLLERQSMQCIAAARRHRDTGSKAPFRSKMLEYRQIQSRIAQLQRFRCNAVLQFDALRNHELNQTFVRAMKGMAGASKGRIATTREDAEDAMENLHESLTEAKELSEFLGAPILTSDMPDDDELEKEFLSEMDDAAAAHAAEDDISDCSNHRAAMHDRLPSIAPSPSVIQATAGKGSAPGAGTTAAHVVPVGQNRRIEDLLDVGPVMAMQAPSV